MAGVTVVTKDKNSVNLYNAETGNFIRNVYVTTGEIVGQPVCNGNMCTMTCLEGGRTTIIMYELPRFTLKNRYKI